MSVFTHYRPCDICDSDLLPRSVEPPELIAVPVVQNQLGVYTLCGMSAFAFRGCTNEKLRKLMRHLGRHYDAGLRLLGLKATQYSLLSYVVALGPIRPSDLACELGLTASTLTRNLEPLVAAGWVELNRGGDARSRLVSATSAGTELHGTACRAWRRTQDSVHSMLGTELVARLHQVIDECICRLPEMGVGRVA